jgi:hypothetical protein
VKGGGGGGCKYHLLAKPNNNSVKAKKPQGKLSWFWLHSKKTLEKEMQNPTLILSKMNMDMAVHPMVRTDANSRLA